MAILVWLEMKDIDGNFAANEGEYWEKLTEGDVYDLDLFTACAIGDYSFVENLLSFAKYRSEIINKKNEGGWTPLMYVSYLGDDKLLELLIREQADILAEEDKHGMTPLILASTSGNTSVVKRLVEVCFSIACLLFRLNFFSLHNLHDTVISIVFIIDIFRIYNQ